MRTRKRILGCVSFFLDSKCIDGSPVPTRLICDGFGSEFERFPGFKALSERLKHGFPFPYNGGSRWRACDHEQHFALNGVVAEIGKCFVGGSAVDDLGRVGKRRDRDSTRTEGGCEALKCWCEVGGGENHRVGFGSKAGQFVRQYAEVSISVSRQAGKDERGDGGICAGERLDAKTTRNRLADNFLRCCIEAGRGEQRHTAIGEGIEGGIVRNDRSGNLMECQENVGGFYISGGDSAYFAEDTEGAQRNVVRAAKRKWDKI